jgi:hypothetical protein
MEKAILWLAAVCISAVCAAQAVSPAAAPFSNDLLRKAQAEDDASQQTVAYDYYYGRGTPVDHQLAAEWYKRSADNGTPSSAYSYAKITAECHDIRYASGFDPKQQAFVYFLKAASVGYPRAYAEVAAFHEAQENYTEAAIWYRIGAELGDPNAEYGLGRLYEEGRGIPRDHQLMMKWYGQAARQGNLTTIQAVHNWSEPACETYFMFRGCRLEENAHPASKPVAPKPALQSKVKPVIARLPDSALKEIHVDELCRLLPYDTRQDAGEKQSLLRSDPLTCHLEDILASGHIEETVTGNQLRRNWVNVVEQTYVLQNMTIEPKTFVAEQFVPQGWVVDSDPQPTEIAGTTASFRVYAQPGEIVRLHVGLRLTSPLPAALLKTIPLAPAEIKCN